MQEKMKPIEKPKEILEEVKRILESEDIKDSDCISLYNVADLMSQIYYKYQTVIINYQEYCEKIIKSKLGNSTSVAIPDFDYEKNELIIGIVDKDSYEEINFAKKDGDLYISKSNSFWDKTVLAAIGVELSELYDEFLNFYDCNIETSTPGISAINSSFLLIVSFYGVSIFTEPSTSIMPDFTLTSSNYKYSYDCNSTVIIEALRGKENKIFNKIFCNIGDCPKWSQEKLYKIRQDELAEEKRQELEKIELLKRKELEEKALRKEHLIKLVKKNYRKMKRRK